MMQHPFVIIGDGFAAAVLLVHLARRDFDLSSITVIGTSPLGHGKAYGTTHPHFRLNVRDNLMVIDQNIPDDFVNWAKHIDDPDAVADNGAGRFYRRGDFARYLSGVLAHHDIEHQITVISGKAIDIKPHQPDHDDNMALWDIRLDNGDMISSRNVILATGNPSPSAQHLIADDMPADLKAKHIIATPWKGDALDNIPSTAHIGLIGGGLTALDACLGLYKNGHKGQISLITPHGILPPPQSTWEHMDIPPFPEGLTASTFLRHIRTYLPDSDWTQFAWQSAYEGLRAQLPDGWRRLPDHDKRRLMNRLGWLWSLIRYRASPQSIAAVNAMQSSGQIQIIKDRVSGIISGQATPPLSLTLNSHDAVDCDYAIIASGIGHDPLISCLIKSHIAGTMDNGGIRVNDDFQLLSPGYKLLPGLWAFGPPTQSALGDVIGATTIAKQAARLADLLLAITRS